MPLLLQGVSVRGRVITSVVPATTATYSLYFPDAIIQTVQFLGGIGVVQLDTPLPGVARDEQFESCWTYCTRFVPLRASASRRIYLQFRDSGMRYEFHN